MCTEKFRIASGSVIDGRYAVHEELGRGGAGVVYRAHDTKNDRMLALKTPLPFLMYRDATRQRFFREMRLASQLQHTNTAALTDVGITPAGLPWFTMDLLNGHDLADTLAQNGPMAPERAMRITAQILASIAEAHTAGIIHRDLKPENVFLCAGDLVKVTDFGLSIAPGEGTGITRHGEAVGTLVYMAPEYLLDNVISPAMDLYAIGLILCEMILGHSPYTGLALDDVHWQKRFDVPLTGDDRRGLGAAAPVVNRAVQTDPTFRYTDAQSMTEELEAILGAGIASRSTAAPPPPSTRPGRPVPAQDLASEHRVY